MKQKKTFKFYIALWVAKFFSFVLKLFRKKATHFPGKIALKICSNFIGMLEKPKTIIGVTGTNGKTTTCNMIHDILEQNGFDFISNQLRF